jgi:hypothetical protein
MESRKCRADSQWRLRATVTYEVLTIIVVANAVATLSLWRTVARKSNRGPRLKKKAATALWHSDPIVPKHDPPKTAGGDFSSLADVIDRQFFADFKEFADVVNWWLADEYKASRFRLQDLPAGDLSLNVEFSDGPTLGRSFAIYYNQTRMGRLEITSSNKYTPENPEVRTSIEIGWTRFLGFEELTEFFGDIALHVSSSNPDERRNAQQSIQSALTKTLWDNYRISPLDDPDFEEWGELTVSFHGTALFYCDRRDAPARRA